MADSLNILNAKGDRVAVDLSVSMYKDAADAGQTLPQFLAQKYETNHDKFGSPFEQLLDEVNHWLTMRLAFTQHLFDYVRLGRLANERIGDLPLLQY